MMRMSSITSSNSRRSSLGRVLCLFALFLESVSAFVVLDPTAAAAATVVRQKNQYEYDSMSSVCSPKSQQRKLLRLRPLQVTYNNMEDLSRAREEFEALLKYGTLNYDHSLDSDKGYDEDNDEEEEVVPLIMTNAGRHRRELEIELLSSLEDTDDAVDELMHLWMYEHTAEEANKLEEMERTCSSGLVEEEETLRQMIVDNPYWAEPRVRLAALLFYKGETESSYRVALEAQRIKPWHFEIVPLLIMLALRQEDLGQALYWARTGLPNLRYDDDTDTMVATQRRKQWVQRAVEAATRQWEDAERTTEEYLRNAERKQLDHQYDEECSIEADPKDCKRRQIAEEDMWQ